MIMRKECTKGEIKLSLVNNRELVLRSYAWLEAVASYRIRWQKSIRG